MTAQAEDRRSARLPDVRLEPSLAAVSPERWDALAQRGHAALRHDYLRAWEQCELRSLRSAPVVMPDDDGRLLAASPGHHYDMDVCAAGWPQGARLLSPLRRLWPGLGFVRTYELGSPTPLTDPFLVDSSVSRDDAVARLIEASVDAGEQNGASFMIVQNFSSQSGPAADELRRRGFAAVPAPATAVVGTAYGSFDDYLAAMRAPYRRRARQTLKRSRELTVEHRTQFAELAGDLAALWQATYRRAREFRRERFTDAVFRAMSAVPEASVLLTRRADGTIASFALLLDDHPWLLFLQCGFHESAGREEGAYFRLLYEIVRHAIENGYDRAELGMTTIEPKLDVGAVPVPLFVWARHRAPLLQGALQRLANGPLRTPDLPARRVFRDPPPSAADIVAEHSAAG